MSKPNAREFVDEIADVLRAQGREVTVEATDHEWGTFVWLSSIGPTWIDANVSLSAAYTNRTKRWRLGEIIVRRPLGADVIKKTRTDIKIAADVYGRLA